MTNNLIKISGKHICGFVFLCIGFHFFLSGVLVCLLLGGFALERMHFMKKYNREYEYETKGYVYDVTPEYTYYMYFDENDEIQYGMSKIHTDQAGIDCEITIRYDEGKEFIYIPELMDGYKYFPVFLGILILFFGIPFMIIGGVLLIFAFRFISGFIKENSSKEQLKGVENNG